MSDLFGDLLKYQGISRAMVSAGEWTPKALALITAWLAGKVGQIVTPDDFRDVVEPVLGPPPTRSKTYSKGNAWGGLAAVLNERGNLSKFDVNGHPLRTVPSRRPSNHSRLIQQYRVLR